MVLIVALRMPLHYLNQLSYRMQKMFLCCLAGGTLLAVCSLAGAQLAPMAADGAQGPARRQRDLARQ